MSEVAELLAIYSPAVGDRFLAYLLNLSEDQLSKVRSGQLTLNEAQQEAVVVLRQIVDVRLPYETQDENKREVLRALLIQPDDRNIPVARRFFQQSGGVDPKIKTTDAVELAVAQLARDVFPAYLLPRDERYPIPIGEGHYVTSTIFRHPMQESFAQAVFGDPTLSAVFPKKDPSIESSTWLWRNTGNGGGVQLVMLPEHILNGAWRHIKNDDPTADMFIAEALKELRIVRDLLVKGAHDIAAILAFTGVKLPETKKKVALSDGYSLEETQPADRELAPDSLKQTLSGTDSTGTNTVINYDGDVLLRFPFPLKARALSLPKAGEVPTWPEDMRPPLSVEHISERLRLSLLMAVQREYRVQLIPTWRYYDDPFGYGKAGSWFDPKNAVGLMPTQLSDEEVEAWVDWYQTLSNPDLANIQLAVTRILRAAAERREPSDVLIDSVIAWENIFGTSEGEPTLRVTASLALLLEHATAKREELRSKLAKIYSLRSTIVHGNRALKNSEVPLCQEALDVALRAVRALARDRKDILGLTDGAARSLRLILESK